jgi:hypothetical protein
MEKVELESTRVPQYFYDLAKFIEGRAARSIKFNNMPKSVLTDKTIQSLFACMQLFHKDV